MSLTPPLSHFTLTLIASDMPFSARPSPLPEDGMDEKSAPLSDTLQSFNGCTKELRASYRVPSRDAGVAAPQTSSHDSSLEQLLPSV